MKNSGLWLDRDPVNRGNLAVTNKTGTVFMSAPIPVRKGQVLAAGSVDSGDMVLVDKISYHFRRPKRGEVFVFTTRNIRGIEVDAKDVAGVEDENFAASRAAEMVGDLIHQHHVTRIDRSSGEHFAFFDRDGALLKTVPDLLMTPR